MRPYDLVGNKSPEVARTTREELTDHSRDPWPQRRQQANFLLSKAPPTVPYVEEGIRKGSRTEVYEVPGLPQEEINESVARQIGLGEAQPQTLAASMLPPSAPAVTKEPELARTISIP